MSNNKVLDELISNSVIDINIILRQMLKKEVLDEIISNSIIVGSIVSLWGLYNELKLEHTLKNYLVPNYKYPHKTMFMFRLLPLITLGCYYCKSISKLASIQNYSK